MTIARTAAQLKRKRIKYFDEIKHKLNLILYRFCSQGKYQAVLSLRK